MLQLHPTNRNAEYSCVGSVCMSAILVPDQQPSHYCHRVSRHLYHFHVWLSTHVWNQDTRPAVIYVTASKDYQACCGTNVFKLCSETEGMFVTVAPGHLAHRIQACISVRFANTFVGVGLFQRICLLHLPQTRSYVFYACTRPMDCLAQLHQTIRNLCYSSTWPAVMSLYVAFNQHAASYSFILSASMNVIFAPSHQPCL